MASLIATRHVLDQTFTKIRTLSYWNGNLLRWSCYMNRYRTLSAISGTKIHKNPNPIRLPSVGVIDARCLHQPSEGDSCSRQSSVPRRTLNSSRKYGNMESEKHTLLKINKNNNHSHENKLHYRTLSTPYYNTALQTSSMNLDIRPSPLTQASQRHLAVSNQQFAHYSAANLVDSTPPAVRPYLKLMRFDRPVGTMLVMWPGLCSLALAADPGCFPDSVMMMKFALGALLMRGAGCTINDMWDKEFDKLVERTKMRPLAAGDLTSNQALVFLGLQLSTALALLLSLNWYTVCVGAVSMVFVALYPLMKRVTYWPQLFLGITFNWGAVMAWPALHSCIFLPVVLPFYCSCIAWTLVYDTIYAHQDKVDDCKIGVKSLALKLGDQTKVWLTGFSLAMCTSLSLAGFNNHMTWPYYAAVGVVGAHLARQIITLDINDSDNCFERFYSNIRLGFVLFAGIVAANLLKDSKNDDDKMTLTLDDPDPGTLDTLVQ